MSTPLQNLAELLVLQAVVGLSQEETQQLQKLRLESNVSESDLRDEMQRIELTAAAADLACFEEETAVMPDHIKDSVLLEAGKFFESSTVTPGSSAASATVITSTKNPVNGWMIATILTTAACLLLLLTPWQIEEPAKSVAQLRDAFLESNPADLIDIGMVSNEKLDPNGLNLSGGRLVWSDIKQEGYMEFPGLKINDPTKEQYQLWIFEKDDLEPHPIDGGVFDIAGPNDVVKIDAKILAKARYFAITVEKPGGVVVSDRSRIATVGENLAAKLAGGE